MGFGRLPQEAKSASFAVPTGLLVYPQFAHLEHVEPRHTRQLMTGTNGYFGKVGRWLREGF
jgi:cell division protein FtsA